MSSTDADQALFDERVFDRILGMVFDELACLIEQLHAVRGRIVSLPEELLPGLFSTLLGVAGAVEGLALATVVEAESRGVITASSATGVAGWVQARAADAGVQVTGPEAKAWQTVAREVTAPDMDVFAQAVTTGRVGVAGGAVLARELRRIRDVVPAPTWDACAGEVVNYAVGGASARELAGLRDILITQYGDDPHHLLKVEKAAYRAREFSLFRVEPGGLMSARLRLDAGMAAIVEATLTGLSAPNPTRGEPAEGTLTVSGGQLVDSDGVCGDSGGLRDERTAGQRRADALVDLCRAYADHPDVVAQARAGSASRAQVVITMNYADLRDQCGYGLTVSGQPLSAATVRAFACDAGVIPLVLGGAGEILDQGRVARTATAGQVAHLRHRDKGCSFPGCNRPPGFCQAHHIQHWAQGGPTDINNLTLLCTRHHVIVHRDDYTAHVTTTGGVIWQRQHPPSMARAG